MFNILFINKDKKEILKIEQIFLKNKNIKIFKEENFENIENFIISKNINIIIIDTDYSKNDIIKYYLTIRKISEKIRIIITGDLKPDEEDYFKIGIDDLYLNHLANLY